LDREKEQTSGGQIALACNKNSVFIKEGLGLGGPFRGGGGLENL